MGTYNYGLSEFECDPAGPHTGVPKRGSADQRNYNAPDRGRTSETARAQKVGTPAVSEAYACTYKLHYLQLHTPVILPDASTPASILFHAAAITSRKDMAGGACGSSTAGGGGARLAATLAE